MSDNSSTMLAGLVFFVLHLVFLILFIVVAYHHDVFYSVVYGFWSLLFYLKYRFFRLDLK